VPEQTALIVDTAPPPSLDGPPTVVGSIGSSYEAGYSAIRSIVDAAARSVPPPPPQPEPKKPEPVKVQRVKVGGDVKQPEQIRRVEPVYPTLARQTRTSGTVRLQCVIGLDGRVTGLRLMSGHPLLVNTAIEAVRQWRYRPTLLNGEPVEVLMNVDVNFRLAN
jgi:protein TonB